MPLRRKSDQTSLVEESEIQEKISRAKRTQPSLVLIAGKPLGKRFPITPPQIVIGRSSDVEVSIDSPHISRKHAILKVQDGKIIVEDLGSTNGTFVNDAKIGHPVILKEGDHIRCGKTIFKFLPKGSVEAFYHEDIHGMAHTDGLTKVFNRMYFLDCLRIEYARARNLGGKLCVIMLDIDHFKDINDTYGHQAGDYILQETCRIIKTNILRSEDQIGRYGGEEFTILLTDTPLHEGSDVAERVRKAIESYSFEFEDKKIDVTISAGIATLTEEDDDPVEIIRRADEALYDAKRSGRNRVVAK